VLTWLEGKLASFKHPKIISFHKTLPREDSGKIFKTRLRRPYWTKVNRSI
jgi:long-chain acyl-CoA synthetase